MGEDDGAAIGLELEERTAIQSQRFDNLPLGRLDLGVDLVGRQIDESCRHLGHEALKLEHIVRCPGRGRGRPIRLILQPDHDTVATLPVCAEREPSRPDPAAVVSPSSDITRALPLNQPVVIEVMLRAAGQLSSGAA